MAAPDVTRLPYPIAYAYQQVLDEDAPDRCFRSCVRAFIATLKYCSMACVGEYLEHVRSGAGGDPQLNEQIRAQLFRPSLGHWNGFLRDILAYRRAQVTSGSDFFADLDRAYFGGGEKPKTTAGQKAINLLIGIRNEWFHPVIEPEAHELPRVLAETRQALDTLLAELSFLADYPLVVRDPDAANQILTLRGPDLAACTSAPWDRSGPLPDQPVILERTDGLVRILFLIGNVATGEDGAADWLLFETADINKKKIVKRLKYLLGNTRGTDEAVYVQSATALRDALAPEDAADAAANPAAATAGEVDFTDVVTRLNQWSSENVRLVSGGAEQGLKHDHRLYVERRSFQGADGIFARFLAGAAPLLAVIGDSGHGKTNLLCALRGSPEARPDAEVQGALFLECSTIGSSGLEAQFDDRFNQAGALAALVAHLREHPDRRVILFLDGLNEYARPRALLQEILQLVTRTPNLRVVTTCRTVAWQTTTQNLVFDEDLLCRPGGKDPVLSQFDPAELEAAYPRYQEAFHLTSAYPDLSPEARRLLRDPLLLRLAAQAYHDTAIPRDPDIQALFRNYERERKLHPQRDVALLEELVAVMWRRGIDQLPKAYTADSPALEALVYEDPVVSSGDARHVCRTSGHVILGPKPMSCPECGCLDLDVAQQDWRITYDRVRDEGFLVEAADDDDRVIRFVYDRYLEYRVGLWLVRTSEDLTRPEVVQPLIDHAARSGRAIFQSALCQTILGSFRPLDEDDREIAARQPDAEQQRRDQLVLDLAASPRAQDQDTAASCLIILVRRGEDARARALVERMVAAGADPTAHALALRVAPDLGDLGDLAILAVVPVESPAILEARGHALYAIGRRDAMQDRAQRLMAELVDRVTPVNLARKQTDAMVTLAEVSLRLLGVRNNDPATIAWITDLWQRLLADQLWLGRKNPLQRGMSAGLRKLIISQGTRSMAGMLERDGVLFTAGGGRAFSPREEEAIRNVLDAWLPQNPALAQIPAYQRDLGPESPDQAARESGAASVLSWLGILACSIRIGTEPEVVEPIYSELFTMAGGFHDQGRGTRYSVISGKNFGTMVHIRALGRDRLRPIYQSVLRHWQALLDEDPGMLLIPEVFKGAPNVLCGIIAESTVLMGDDLTETMLRPLRRAAEHHGLPELIRAWYKVAPVALNSFSRDFLLYKHFLKSLADEGLDDPAATADSLGLDVAQVRQWLLESLAILSMGYPSAVEAWVQESEALDSSTMNAVANARSRPSEILGGAADGVTLAAEYHRLVARWSFADGSIQLLNQYGNLREGLRQHLLSMFEHDSAESWVRASFTQLLQHVVDGDLRKLASGGA
jgi:hypothetical protein